MKRRDGLSWVILAIFVVAFWVIPAWSDDGREPCTIMHPDKETLQQWIRGFENAPVALIDRSLTFRIPLQGSLSLLDHLDYTPFERDQGYCGNCWVWAGTGIMGIALDVEEDVFDRLSVQYVNSCFETRYACCGGVLEDFVDFYAVMGKAVPWSAQNGSWHDYGKMCSSMSSDVPCSAVSVIKNYPIRSIEAESIRTQDVSREEAIANIKNVLNQNRAVLFGFFMPTNDDWLAFFDFWQNESEIAVWNPDYSCDHTWRDGGGHGVLCVGYNDNDPENRYWIMLNSWGVSGGDRPNGIFRVDMDMNYGCRFYMDGEPEYSFYWQTLDLAFGAMPIPITGETALVTTTSAMLTGTVNPGMVQTDYYFEYGTSAAYGKSTEQRDVGSGSSDVSVRAEITGLSVYTPYHYRLAATNGIGTSYGEDRVFVTLPPPPSAVTTGEAGAVTSSTAMLAGTFNPGVAVKTDYYFEYGTSAAYGQTSAHGSVGSSTIDVSVSMEITGLSGDTLYHYRLAAANEGGTSYGEDGSFTTETSPSGGDGGGGGCFITTTGDGF